MAREVVQNSYPRAGRCRADRSRGGAAFGVAHALHVDERRVLAGRREVRCRSRGALHARVVAHPSDDLSLSRQRPSAAVAVTACRTRARLAPRAARKSSRAPSLLSGRITHGDTNYRVNGFRRLPPTSKLRSSSFGGSS